MKITITLESDTLEGIVSLAQVALGQLEEGALDAEGSGFEGEYRIVSQGIPGQDLPEEEQSENGDKYLDGDDRDRNRVQSPDDFEFEDDEEAWFDDDDDED